MEDQVGKLIEPAPVPFTFTAPGWYVLGGIAALLILFIVLLMIRYYRLNLYRKHALLQLSNIQQNYTTNGSFDLLVYEADLLIKRIAIARYGRQNVSGLRGNEWISFINKRWREKSFDSTDGQLLERKIYESGQPVSGDEASLFVQKTKRWIKNHKRKF
ncbi:MAG TPA: DUF4381 domain-containing protein [Mucilaginibacter sp.]|jgi:hypothetical protein